MSPNISSPLIVRHKGICQYDQVYQAMVAFTDQRDRDTTDEVWLLEHFPVYTLGLNTQYQHLIRSSEIPVIETDRGGQITYHGPGQLIVYLLMNIKHKAIGVREFIHRLEQSVIGMLQHYNIDATRRRGAPGVYVGHKKISALGIRLTKGCSYHGISINIDMDLSPYDNINTCGYAGLEVTQMKNFGINDNVQQISEVLLSKLVKQLNYSVERINCKSNVTLQHAV